MVSNKYCIYFSFVIALFLVLDNATANPFDSFIPIKSAQFPGMPGGMPDMPGGMPPMPIPMPGRLHRIVRQIAPEDLAEIYESFRTKREARGRGTGGLPTRTG